MIFRFLSANVIKITHEKYEITNIFMQLLLSFQLIINDKRILTKKK